MLLQAQAPAIQPEAWQILAMANQARVAAGTGPLTWDPALAAAARKHCLRMAAEGPLAHRYGGELDLTERAGLAGAHFSLIEENVALAPTPAAIHQAWMTSPEHRSNLLNPQVDSVGIAVVAARGVLYAVADYARQVPVLSPAQAESAVAGLLRARGIRVLADATDARAACPMDRGMPRTLAGPQPGFVVRWQDADLSHLPPALANRLGGFREAEVGNCPASAVEGAFTTYRIAVLLYAASPTER